MHPYKTIVTPKAFIQHQKENGRYSGFKPPRGIIFCYDKDLMRNIDDNQVVKKD
jgi:hypothetical protein